MPSPSIRLLGPEDETAAAQLLDVEFAGRLQARLGEIHDVLGLPGLVAEADAELVGLATYDLRGTRAELAVFVVSTGSRQAGTGTALLEAVVAAVSEQGARELWLVTTNDNLDALRFYQRRGFRLADVRAGSLDEARAVKPTIPLVGRYGIPLRDELILVRPLP